MKVTNIFQLPNAFEQIAQDFYQYKDKQFSATAILGSIRELLLKKRHNDEIVIDCSEMLYALLGQSLHAVLEKYSEDKNEFKEEYLIETLSNGYKISGRLDLYNAKTKTISDYKSCSVWSIIYKSDYDKWKKQLLIYAWLLRKAGFDVEKGEIIAMIKDWKKSEAKYNKDYPQMQIQKIEFTFREEDFKYIEDFLEERFKEIERCESLKDEDLPMCSLEERFNSGNKYAVMKKGNKRAVKVFDIEKDAQDYAETNDDYYVETREGEDKKCLDYCNVCQFCSYWKEKYGKN